MTSDALQIVVSLRDGSEHVLEIDADADAAHVFDEVSAGRSQLLRGWVSVVPRSGATRAVVHGEEVVQLQLVSQRFADAL